jgi:hypothetical protein
VLDAADRSEGEAMFRVRKLEDEWSLFVEWCVPFCCYDRLEIGLIVKFVEDRKKMASPVASGSKRARSRSAVVDEDAEGSDVEVSEVLSPKKAKIEAKVAKIDKGKGKAKNQPWVLSKVGMKQ